MFLGFDYGTANCSVALAHQGQYTTLKLEGEAALLPSIVSAPLSSMVSEWLYRCHDIDYQTPQQRALLQQSLRLNREEDLTVQPDSVQFGINALNQYIADPEETWVVKSPKSFLGAKGLHPQQIAFFEDVVCAMMLHIRQQAEQQIDAPITHTVIGRPVNFQGSGGEQANQQAITILERAAQRAGFKTIEFQYEPVAAGLTFEASLPQETRVLVVDIGGGTTDCSLLLMGPQWQAKRDRADSLLAHSGCRVGGNDLDIMLAFKQFMPLLGMGGNTLNGNALPTLPWWNAVAINDVMAQGDFYSRDNGKLLAQLVKDAQQPEVVARLATLWKQKKSFQVVRSAEQTKIALSNTPEHLANLGYLAPELSHCVTEQALQQAISTPLTKIIQQITEVMSQAETEPDVIFVTGGSGRSPLIRQAISQHLPGIPITSGDDLGSVTSGLARWAHTLFA